MRATRKKKVTDVEIFHHITRNRNSSLRSLTFTSLRIQPGVCDSCRVVTEGIRSGIAESYIYLLHFGHFKTIWQSSRKTVKDPHGAAKVLYGAKRRPYS